MLGLNAVAAVHDGYVLKKSIVQSPLGGQLLTRCMRQAVLKKGSELHPQVSLRRLETAPGKFEAWHSLCGALHWPLLQFGAGSVVMKVDCTPYSCRLACSMLAAEPVQDIHLPEWTCCHDA